MTIDITTALAGLRFPRDLQLPNRVIRSPRLLSFIPAEELEPIVAAYVAAQRAAKDAAAVKYEADDITAGVRASIAKGEDIDAAALIKKMPQQAAMREAHRNAVAFLQTLPNGPRDDLAGLIMDYRPELYAGLAAQLDEVLDQAEEAITALNGAYDAESAIDQRVTAEFSAFRALAAEHADIRKNHLHLVNAESDLPVGEGNPIWAFCMFAGIADVYPDLTPVQDAPRLEGWQHTRPEPFPIYETDDRAHLLYVVQHRAALRPHLATGAEARVALKATKDARAAEATDQPQAREVGGEFVQYYGEAGLLCRQYGG